MVRIINVLCSLALISLSASLADDGLPASNTQLVQDAQTAMKEKGITLPPDSPVRVLPEDGLVFVEFYNRDFSRILARAYFDRQGHRFELIDHDDDVPKIDGSVDLSGFLTADSLWKKIKDLEFKQNLLLKQNPPNDNRPQVFYGTVAWAWNAAMVAAPNDNWPQVFYATSEFITRYPDDPRRWEAKLLWFRSSPFIDSAMLKHSLAETIAAGDAPDAVKGDARQWLAVLAKPKQKQPTPVASYSQHAPF